MRCVSCVRAAAVAAAASLVYCVCIPVGPAAAGDDGTRLLLFSGADVWRDGQFAHGGLLWSLNRLDREGFTLKAMISGGRYRYQSGAFGNAWVNGTEENLQLLPGWHFKHDRFELKVLAGLDVKHGATWPDDPDNRLRGTHVGLRVSGDLWYEPTATTMLAADASLTSIAADYSARLAYGWRVNDWFYLGPEMQTFACDGYSQFRFGLHVTALRTGRWEWSAAAGWADDSDRRSGGYLRLGVLTRR